MSLHVQAQCRLVEQLQKRCAHLEGRVAAHEKQQEQRRETGDWDVCDTAAGTPRCTDQGQHTAGGGGSVGDAAEGGSNELLRCELGT